MICRHNNIFVCRWTRVGNLGWDIDEVLKLWLWHRLQSPLDKLGFVICFSLSLHWRDVIQAKWEVGLGIAYMSGTNSPSLVGKALFYKTKDQSQAFAYTHVHHHTLSCSLAVDSI